jgi:hypothetical protein
LKLIAPLISQLCTYSLELSYLALLNESLLKFGVNTKLQDALSLSSISAVNLIVADSGISTLENVKDVHDFLAVNSTSSTNILNAVT